MHPILFELGPITIYSYGVLVASAFLIATYLYIKELRKNPVIKTNEAIDLALYVLISGIIGARLLHVMLNLEFYTESPVRIFLLNRGGLAFQGGIIAATGVSVWFLIKRNLPVWKVGDLLAPYIALGQSIGRIGCFFNGCCFGKPAEFVLAVTFPNESLARHPTQLYSVFGLFAIFLILRFLYKRRHFDGRVLLGYFILFSAFRFFIDFLRGDLAPVSFGLTASQLISIAIILFAVIILLLRGGPKGQRSKDG